MDTVESNSKIISIREEKMLRIPRTNIKPNKSYNKIGVITKIEIRSYVKSNQTVEPYGMLTDDT